MDDSIKSPETDDSAGQQDPGASEAHHASRIEIVWRVLLFQFKLIADGLRDLILSPVSLIAVLMGLLSGGKQPDIYFKRLMRFGRKSDVWINLFDQHHSPYTANNLVKPVQRKFMQGMDNPVIARGAKGLNKALDQVNSGVEEHKQSKKSTES